MTLGGTAGLYRGPMVNETAFSGSVKDTMDRWRRAANPVIQGAAEFEATVASIDPAKAIGAAVVIFPVAAPLAKFGQNPVVRTGFFVPQIFPLATRESIAFPLKDLARQLDRALTAIDEPGPNAYRAFKEIGKWLVAGDEEVADAVGVGRTTPYSWRRDGREPRRGTAQRIYEFHAVLNAVRRQLGQERFSLWLLGGEPSRRDALLAGDLESIATSVDAVLFRSERPRSDLAWRGEDAGPVEDSSKGDAPRASRRRPRRAQLR
jgi:hypothetical protein